MMIDVILDMVILVSILFLVLINLNKTVKPRIIKLYDNVDIELTQDNLSLILNNLAERISILEKEKEKKL